MRIENYTATRIPLGDRLWTWFLATCLIFAVGFLVMAAIDTRRDIRELDASRIQLESKVAAALEQAGVKP